MTTLATVLPTPPPAPFDARRAALRRNLLRVIVAASSILAINYLSWRWTSSINYAAWWIAVPLVLAETYSLLDAMLFGATVWRIRERGPAPPPPPDATVDVFVCTYNEPIELVMGTALGARAIRYPHTTWVLDDGNRPEMRAAAEAEGIGYITRSPDWQDRPRHAKAGNLNNALLATTGEFMLILDADQIPAPEILDRTLGWFTDPKVGLVQTPQYFTNVPDDDPLGSQAPLFYGPIQQGKDGWNSAFFCGSNAILRREALMQLGIVNYIKELRKGLNDALATADRVIRQARRDAGADADPNVLSALDAVARSVTTARRDLAAGEPASEVTYRFQREVQTASMGVVASDLEALRADLDALRELQHQDETEFFELHSEEHTLSELAKRSWSPLGALEGVQTLVRSVDVDRSDEAQAIMPMATISVTEDMATAMRMHSLGWSSVYHHEVLAYGLAPEDLGSMLHQRLRWAQGTIQVMLRENPLVQRGLSVGQRFMYLGTMWTYLSGVASLFYIAAPILYLFFGVRPVTAYGGDFLWHLVPYLVVNQLLFLVVGWGVKTWRGQQYSLGLFPLWIRAVWTAVGNVYFKQSLGFVVTPKTKQNQEARPWKLVRPQLTAMGLLFAAVIAGFVRLALGVAPSAAGTFVNVFWVIYDLVVLSVVIDAVFYRGMEEAQ